MANGVGAVIVPRYNGIVSGGGVDWFKQMTFDEPSEKFARCVVVSYFRYPHGTVSAGFCFVRLDGWRGGWYSRCCRPLGPGIFFFVLTEYHSFLVGFSILIMDFSKTSLGRNTCKRVSRSHPFAASNSPP